VPQDSAKCFRTIGYYVSRYKIRESSFDPLSAVFPGTGGVICAEFPFRENSFRTGVVFPKRQSFPGTGVIFPKRQPFFRNGGHFPGFNPLDSEVLYNYKSRSRLRGETFNGRSKQYKISENTYSRKVSFRHGREKHELAFSVVVVTWQYHISWREILFTKSN
jgi:hypothetical protein